ncbi:MAG: energy transducer TonB [Verrucomicrobiota bacterium]|jgi:protein TonB
MNALDANRTELGYELRSELARSLLHATDRDPNRTLAWMNSVCILFLLIGAAGSKPAVVAIKPLPAIEEVTAAIVEPLPPPPQAQPEQLNQEQSNEETPDTPQVVVVTPDAPAINFAVPTIGNLVVPNAIAKAPPLAPLGPVAPLRRQPILLNLNSTGSSGERPQPPYPKIALAQGQQGSVMLRMTVDEAGLITTIEVAQSSGFPILDRSALEFVKRHWTVPSGKGARIYEAPIIYRIQPD